MSSDVVKTEEVEHKAQVSIPLEQGNVFRLNGLVKAGSIIGSLNPFGTGQCLPTVLAEEVEYQIGLNPFGTGQCLPTLNMENYTDDSLGLNPFGTGQCLPTICLNV